MRLPVNSEAVADRQVGRRFAASRPLTPLWGEDDLLRPVHPGSPYAKLTHWWSGPVEATIERECCDEWF